MATAKKAQEAADGEPRRREPAPLVRARAEERIDGCYIVAIRQGVDPVAVAARHGVAPTSVARGFNTFSAEMTDAQVASLRIDPDTEHITEDHLVFPC